MDSIRYVALLRGINVGGKTVHMEDLKKTFVSLGFENVKTLLNSGNVIFDAKEKNIPSLKVKIEKALKDVFGFQIAVFLRTISHIQTLVESKPFVKIVTTPQTKCNVTFLSDEPASPLQSQFDKKNFTIITLSKQEICWSIELSANFGTTEAMTLLEKQFGKNMTTRTWNTVVKICRC